MVCLTDTDHFRRMVDTLWSQVVTGEGTDVILECGGYTFNAHSCILRSYPLFFEQFKDGFQVEFQDNVTDPDIFERILKFLYTGNINIAREFLPEIQDFASKYGLEPLSNLCAAHREEMEKMDDTRIEESVTVVVESALTDCETPSKSRKRGRAKLLKCLECKKTFKQPSELSKHYAEHANEVSTNFCKTCGIRLTADVTEHNHPCYFNPDHKEPADIKRCPFCLQHCETHTMLLHHEKEHHCNNCNKVFDTLESQADHQCQNIWNEKIVYECSQCVKSYTSKQCFINHLKVHNGQNYLTCQFCSKTFLHYLPFKKHVLAHTEGRKEQYECQVCKEKFRLKIKYYAHCIKFSHTLHEVPHGCKVCKRLFSNERDLNSHCRTHYAEKPFKCAECEKTYSSKLGLKLHIDSVHLKQLRYQCGECGKKFLQPSHLSEHKRVHVAEKEFVCSVCGLQLSCKTSLRRHENRHRGSREFPCSKCPKNYAIEQDLNRHRKFVHGTEDKLDSTELNQTRCQEAHHSITTEA